MNLQKHYSRIRFIIEMNISDSKKRQAQPRTNDEYTCTIHVLYARKIYCIHQTTGY